MATVTVTNGAPTSGVIKWNRRAGAAVPFTCHATGTWDSSTLTPQFSLTNVAADFDNIADATALTNDGHFNFNTGSGFYRFVSSGGLGSEDVDIESSEGNVVTAG